MNKIFDNNGQMHIIEDFVSESSVDFNLLKNEISWRHDSISMFGKTHLLPRLTAWYGDPGIKYTYSKITMEANGWTPTLQKINQKLKNELHLKFNSVLINYYRNGLDHMSFHSDDEKELGNNPTIASVSIGATRKFVLKHKFKLNEPKFEIELKNGSLLIMSGELQNFWNHKITKSTKVQDPRINLTFRSIKN